MICSLAAQSLERRDCPSSLPQVASLAAVGNATEDESNQGVTPRFVPMFNGTNTAGWFNPFDTGRAWAKDGQILLSGDKKFFLVSRQSYTNFILAADILIPVQGRGGLQFRASYDDNFVNGYKADVITSDSILPGGLWSQSRGWLDRPSQKAHVVPGHWNEYEVEAIGDHITILVNNTATVNTQNSLFKTGRIALQDHGTKDAVYRFKDVEIEDLGG
jgi:hypothetical protein